jgi:hypothetical protein
MSYLHGISNEDNPRPISTTSNYTWQLCHYSRTVRPMKGLAEKEDTYWPRDEAAQLPEMKVAANIRNFLKSGSMPAKPHHTTPTPQGPHQ